MNRNLKLAHGIFTALCVAIITAGVISSCATPPPKPPATFLESVEALNVVNDEFGHKVARLTCKTFAAGVCTQPGFTIDPDKGVSLLKDSNTVRTTLRMAANIPAGAVGNCGNTVGTREECLASAQTLLDALQAAVTPH